MDIMSTDAVRKTEKHAKHMHTEKYTMNTNDILTKKQKKIWENYLNFS